MKHQKDKNKNDFKNVTQRDLRNIKSVISNKVD